MIQAKQVVKKRGDFCLGPLDLRLEVGERVEVQGPSGSGKSTLVAMILGNLKADQGQITRSFNRVATVFQEDRLLEDSTVQENLALVRPWDQAAQDLVQDLGLGDGTKKARDLSGGMRRRLALARALHAGGDLYILDEPFTGQDKKNQERITRLLVEKTQGASLIIISHVAYDRQALGIQRTIQL